ncbi:MAG: TetR/AcrR family transcriptional regulator [Thaumarchaeota archaeon]|nr:TetR/AcrR family transcriptional regulator [Nitrososphaerota archaeon]
MSTLAIQKSRPGPAAILEAAARLFTEKGYANVSIRDVCRAAETSPPTIYYYFKNKKGLFDAAVSQRVSLGGFIANLRETTSKGDTATRVSKFIEVYLDSFPTQAFQPGLYMIESAKLDHASAAKISEQLDQARSIATSIVERGIKEGDLRRVEPESAADCLIGMLNHVVFQQFHFSKLKDPKKWKSFITQFFLDAMLAP